MKKLAIPLSFALGSFLLFGIHQRSFGMAARFDRYLQAKALTK